MSPTTANVQPPGKMLFFMARHPICPLQRTLGMKNCVTSHKTRRNKLRTKDQQTKNKQKTKPNNPLPAKKKNKNSNKV